MADKRRGRKPKSPEEKRSVQAYLTPHEADVIRQLRETGTLPDSHFVQSDMHALKVNDKAKRSDKRYKEALRELDEVQRQLGIMSMLDSNPHEIKARLKKASSEGTAVMVASDWHVEERVDPETVNGRNNYTPKIATKRADNFFRNGLFLVNLMRSGITINDLVVPILGDIISGYIHEELQESNFMSPIEATQLGIDLICSGIDFLLKEGGFKQIVIPCCAGNHGRTTIRQRVNTRVSNSFETLMYRSIAKVYRDNPKVHFIIESGYHTYLDVYNYRLRFHHGDAVRYQGGVGGISIPVNKAIAQWNKNIPADLDVFGHWHTFMDGNNFISNGSLIGWNAFALKIKATYNVPEQSFFIIDKEHGKTIVAPIHVEKTHK